MKKKWLFILIFILSLSFFACKKDDKDSKENGEEKPVVDENDDKNKEVEKEPEPSSENPNDEEPSNLELIFSETCFYDLASNEDLSVKITNLTKIDSLKLDDELTSKYEIKDEKLVISKDLLNNIGYKNVICEFTSNNKTYMFNIKIADSREPVLNDVVQKNYVGDDITFNFDLYDGKIVDVKYNNEELCIDCYKINGNVITINKSYIVTLPASSNALEYKISYSLYNEPNKVKYMTGNITIINPAKEQFVESLFNTKIVITDKSSTGEKTFSASSYNDFYQNIKNFQYIKYNFDESSYSVKYNITFGENIINVYDNNIFTLNGEKFIITNGSFIFLKDYSYSINSGDLPWI